MLQPITYNGRDMSELLKLSGMKYKQGYFSPTEWEHKTGVNPLSWTGYISVCSGFCFWEPAAERIADEHYQAVICNWIVIGISARGGVNGHASAPGIPEPCQPVIKRGAPSP